MSALFPEDVADYLKNHPSFFEQYADLMAQIFLPHPHGGRAISLAERQMLSLREKNRAAEAKLAELITFGEENDAISEKVHRLAVGLIAAETFQAVIHLINFHLRDDFAVPHVALRLWDKPEGIEDLPEFAAVSEELQVFAETLGRPYCGSTAGFGTASWFGEQAPHIRSQALIALRNGGGTIGLIALGSEEGQRFYAEMGTLYLERLGELVSAALARVTKSML
ncbi:MAG: DUF484 family protein [Azonexus sp.]|jgi:uncharacterized protein YigA (DUF484 family)|uniref:DUF484 family protein n=1 Tax=Azonexus sp. TaxID=1872668 RepID=UPI002835DE5D|nr:DUF484 family protein [Azonexus sp.]MDR0775778.1 DUF484 family protein [Azonexus sp.]